MKLELSTTNDFLNNLTLLFLSKHCKINLNQKRKIRRFNKFVAFPMNNFFSISLFIQKGLSVFSIIYRGSLIETELRKTLKYMGLIIKIHLIKGLVGKRIAKFFYSTVFIFQWNIGDKKIFWKYWLFNEILKSNKQVRTLLFRFRKCYFITLKHTIFKGDFFK